MFSAKVHCVQTNIFTSIIRKNRVLFKSFCQIATMSKRKVEEDALQEASPQKKKKAVDGENKVCIYNAL